MNTFLYDNDNDNSSSEIKKNELKTKIFANLANLGRHGRNQKNRTVSQFNKLNIAKIGANFCDLCTRVRFNAHQTFKVKLYIYMTINKTINKFLNIHFILLFYS